MFVLMTTEQLLQHAVCESKVQSVLPKRYLNSHFIIKMCFEILYKINFVWFFGYKGKT